MPETTICHDGNECAGQDFCCGVPLTRPEPTNLKALRLVSSENYIAPGKYARVPNPVCQAAADEIEWLRERVTELEQLHD